MESANSTLKVERGHDERHTTRQQAIDDLTQYIGYYNTERSHRALDYDSPVQFERRWAVQQQHTQPIGTATLEPALLAMESACQAQKADLLAAPTCADNGEVTP